MNDFFSLCKRKKLLNIARQTIVLLISFINFFDCTFLSNAEEPEKTLEFEKNSASQDILADDEDGSKMMVTFMHALAVLKSHYVNPEKVTYERMFRSALRGVMTDLDPYSSFETKQDYEQAVVDFSGKFGGIGVVLTTQNDKLEILSVEPEGGAAKAGIVSGDVILEINGVPVDNLRLSDSIQNLRGEVGTILTLKLKNLLDEKIKEVKIVRDYVETPSVSDAHVIPNTDGVAYIRIKLFGQDTAKKLDDSLKTLSKNGMKSLILDLRNNPGGLVESAAEVCSRFLPNDKLVVTLEWREVSKNVSYKTIDCKKYLNLPIIILVNENSASASELASSALRDYKRAVILGNKTFGKGSAQNILPIGDIGALRFTVAYYYTPSHTQIHKVGLQPDITVCIPKEQKKVFNEQLEQYSGIVKPDDSNSIKDIQLERAIEVLQSAFLLRSSDSQ